MNLLFIRTRSNILSFESSKMRLVFFLFFYFNISESSLCLTISDMWQLQPTAFFSLRGCKILVHLTIVVKWKCEMLVAQLCLTLCDPMDCNPPGSSVHGILQARIMEWVAIPFSRGSFWPRDWTRVSCIADVLYWLSHQGAGITITSCLNCERICSDIYEFRGRQKLSHINLHR